MKTFVYIDEVPNLSIVVCNNIIECFVLVYQELGFYPEMKYVTELDSNKHYVIENNQLKEVN